MGDPVRVSVIALDPMLEAGATSALLGRPGVAVVPPDDGADVTVVVVDGISDRVFDLVRERRDRPGRPEVVLVATDFAASEALHAIAVAAGLRLIADGRETDEIARERCYSPRTVVGVAHDITHRFRLRNRAHAVADAMRTGLL